MAQSVLWKELTAEDLRAKAKADAVVILPVASIEQHGPHLPVGVDTILTEAVCRRRREASTKTPVVVAPVLWCGMAEHHMAFGGTFTLDIPTYRAVLLVLPEEHRAARLQAGASSSTGTAATRPPSTPSCPISPPRRALAIRAATYFDVAPAAMKQILEDQEGVRHACEAETSMMLVAAPETVKRERFAGGVRPPFSQPRAACRPCSALRPSRSSRQAA